MPRLQASLEADALELERRAREELRARAGMAPRLDDAMAYSLLAGGKRLRPMLCLWIER